jgi:integral membrane protein
MKIRHLRVLSIIEGISMLLLLFVAMPIKYVLGNPMVVKYVGMTHGWLFIAFLIVLLTVSHQRKWDVITFVQGIIAAILPFGPFIFERKLKRLDAEDKAALV